MSGSYIGHADADRVQIDDNEVTTSKIANNAVTGIKIAMGSDAQGDILYYNGTDYARLGVGSSGQFLKTQGAGANPIWGSVSTAPSMGGDLSGVASNATIVADAVTTTKILDNNVTLAKIADGTQGGTFYFGASGAPAELAAGTSGKFLKTQGTGANPIWDDVPAGAPTGGGSDKVFFENEQTVDSDYTITAGYNAVTAGPCAVASGVTVTLTGTSAWVIV